MCKTHRTPLSTLFPYTTLFRSAPTGRRLACGKNSAEGGGRPGPRSEEHTSELQSRGHLVCRLLLEKKNRHGLPQRGRRNRHRSPGGRLGGGDQPCNGREGECRA